MLAQMKIMLERMGLVIFSDKLELRKDVTVTETATFEKAVTAKGDVDVEGTLSPAVVVIPSVDDEAAVAAIDPPVVGQIVYCLETDAIYVATSTTAGITNWEVLNSTTGS